MSQRRSPLFLLLIDLGSLQTRTTGKRLVSVVNRLVRVLTLCHLVLGLPMRAASSLYLQYLQNQTFHPFYDEASSVAKLIQSFTEE